MKKQFTAPVLVEYGSLEVLVMATQTGANPDPTGFSFPFGSQDAA